MNYDAKQHTMNNEGRPPPLKNVVPHSQQEEVNSSTVFPPVDQSGRQPQAQQDIRHFMPHISRARRDISLHAWKRVLYEKQDFPDDYIDDTFLASLVTNANVRHHDLLSMIRASTCIVNKLSLLALIFVVFLGVRPLSQESVPGVLFANIGFIGVCLGIVLALRHKFNLEEVATSSVNVVWQSLLFLAALIALSPILQTLTLSFSDDTMWALTMLFSSIHIVFYDYKRPSFSAEFSGALSLNAGVFATVLLASRLPTVQHVLFFTLASIEVFALAPVAIDYTQARVPILQVPLSIILTIITFTWLFDESRLVAFVYLTGVAFIALVCPYWFTHVMRYKTEIQGPWDIAKVTAFN